MMRDWFILFATTFTITTLTVSVSSWLISDMQVFGNQYILFLAISSALLALCLNLFHKLSIESYLLTIVLDLAIIFTIVFTSGVMLQLYPLHIEPAVITFVLVVIIYFIITLIYHFILMKEAEDMTKKITDWRNKHVDR